MRRSQKSQVQAKIPSHATATLQFLFTTFFVHFKMNMYLNPSQRLLLAMQHLLKNILKAQADAQNSYQVQTTSQSKHKNNKLCSNYAFWANLSVKSTKKILAELSL